MNILLIRWILYLALDDSSSLVPGELLNDVATNVTCPSDGEFRVSRHEQTLSTVRVIFSPQMLCPRLFMLFRSICHSHVIMLTKLKLLQAVS
jgi:hypothetical protein